MNSVQNLTEMPFLSHFFLLLYLSVTSSLSCFSQFLSYILQDIEIQAAAKTEYDEPK